MTDPGPRRPGRWRAVQRATLVLAVLAAFLVGAVVRVSQGPVDLPRWLVEVAEDRLTRALAGPDVGIESLALAYDADAHRLGLSLRGGTLRDAGTLVMRLPEARVILDGAHLLRGRVRPQSVTLNGLSLDVARDAEGQFSLAFGTGAGGDLPQNWEEGLRALDAALAIPFIAELQAVRVGGITLSLRDEITGLAQTVEDGEVALTRSDEAARLTLTLSVPTGAGQSARISAEVRRAVDGTGGAEASLALVDLPFGYLAEVFPNVPALSLVRGRISASSAMAVSEAGAPGPLRGRVEIQNATLTSALAPMGLDRAGLAVSWQPGSHRVALSEITAASDDILVAAQGQILLEDGITGPLQTQLTFDEIRIDPEEVFERSVRFDKGLFEARLTQAPLALRIGQAMLAGPSGTARLSGNLTFQEDGAEGGLRLSVPKIDVADLRALWPRDLQPESRRWFTRNMLAGIARNVEAALRLRPGVEPEVLGSFDYDAGSLRFMRFMPPAENARGAAQLDGTRLSLRIDAAEVPGLGPGQTPTGQEGRIQITDSSFVIADARQRPPRGALTLNATGEIGDVLALLNNRPLELLDRLDKGPDFATGQAQAVVRVELPLRPRNAPVDIDWDVAAILRNVQSEQLVRDRTIQAQSLRMVATPDAVEIGGDLTLDGVPFSGSWRQALPPRGTEPIDPDAPRRPPQPLPEAGRITGVATVTPQGLARLGIDLGAVVLSGETRARVEITLPQGAPPELVARSTLEGMGVALPAVSWRKRRSRAAEFEVAAILSDVPRVPKVSFRAPGLSAEGQVTLNAGGGLRRAAFDRVDIGWFAGPVVFTGRGRGAAPAISIRGGSADLRRALLVGEGSSGGEGSPLDITLRRLTVTDGITLTDLRAQLRGGSGQFSGRVNGGQPIEGVLAPDGTGSAVQIRSGNAGGVLQSAALFKDARGGGLSLTLRPTEAEGTYRGALRISNMRVRNAPALASLLQALSVVGILEQLGGEGLFFQTVESDFTLRPNDILVRRASAVGPSMSITADGTYDSTAKRMDLEGVVSPIYLVNGLFGALFSRRDEGLFGFTYRLRGAVEQPQVSVNPLSILTPGVFREIFRRPPPEG